MIQFGNPPALQYYEEEKFLSITIKKPETERTLLELIKEQLSHIKHAHVCLSGGVDSQFAIRVLQEMNVSITAHTYLTTWKGSPLNTDDVVTARMLTDKQNIKLNVTEIDLHDFFSNNIHMEYGKKYGTPSPQIAVHLYYLETTFKDIGGTVVLGGDIPMMVKDSDVAEGPLDIAGLNSSFIMKNTQAYYAVARDSNFNIVKDMPEDLALLFNPLSLFLDSFITS